MLPKLIGLTGYSTVGKSEVAKYLRRVHKYEGDHVKLPMVEMAISLMAHMGINTGEAYERLDGTLKFEPIPNYPWLTGATILKALGKDLRDALGDPAKSWIKVDDTGTTRGVDESLFFNFWLDRNSKHSRAINESLRYPFEGTSVMERGGVVIRVHRPGVGPLNDHPSETSIVPYNILLTNEGTLDDLVSTIEATLLVLELQTDTNSLEVFHDVP